MKMKRIKINDSYLDKVLAQDMLEPSITKVLKGGHIYAYASFEFEFKQEKIFKRRKVLRLIRKHKKELKKVYVDGMLFYVKRDKNEKN